MFKTFLQKTFGKSKPGSSMPDPELLLKAMNDIAREDTTATRDHVYKAFLNSWLWFCVPEMPERWKEGVTVVPEGMQVKIAIPTNKNGKKVLPVFTDPDALKNYDPNTPHMALQAREIFKMALNMGVDEIVVNPFDPIRKPIRAGGNLTRREFEALANGMIPQRLPDGKGQVVTVQRATQVAIGRCATPLSEDIRLRLQNAAEQFPELHRIYRFRTSYPETGTVSDLLMLDCAVSRERFHEIAAGLMSTIQPLLPSGQYIDLRALTPSDGPLVKKFGEIIYDRRS